MPREPTPCPRCKGTKKIASTSFRDSRQTVERTCTVCHGRGTLSKNVYVCINLQDPKLVTVCGDIDEAVNEWIASNGIPDDVVNRSGEMLHARLAHKLEEAGQLDPQEDELEALLTAAEAETPNHFTARCSVEV